jgi:Fe-S-cluster containining protein
VSGDTSDALDAGDFGSWLQDLHAALRGEADAVVPCGTCTACCTSSQFVHIAPDEIDTLAHVPTELRFPAPGLPKGHVVLGYDERGHCPMLVDGACSIYEHRPRTCRTYDCRVFAATDVAPDPSQPLIAERAARWRFTVRTDAERTVREQLRQEAAVRAELPPTRRAVAAIEALVRSR